MPRKDDAAAPLEIVDTKRELPGTHKIMNCVLGIRNARSELFDRKVFGLGRLKIGISFISRRRFLELSDGSGKLANGGFETIEEKGAIAFMLTGSRG
jgi:hypothetical protein